METIPTVTEVSQVIDYTPVLVQMEELLNTCADASVLISGFLLFFVIVCLCYFVYKFFRIFF